MGTEKSSGLFSTLYRSRIVNAMNYKSSPTEVKIINGESIKLDSINYPIQV